MTRYHTTAEGNIPFTAEEEKLHDEREAAWLARRELEAKEHEVLAAIEKNKMESIRSLLADGNTVEQVVAQIQAS